MSNWADGLADLAEYDDGENYDRDADYEEGYVDHAALWANAKTVVEYEADFEGNRYEVTKKVRTYHVDRPTTAADLRAKFKPFNKGDTDQSMLVSREPPLALEIGTVDQFERETRNEVKRLIHESSSVDVKVSDPHLAIIEKMEQAKKQAGPTKLTASPTEGADKTWGANRSSNVQRDSDDIYKRRIRVTNVADYITQTELQTLFDIDGCEVERVFLPSDKVTHRHLGFAFITFRDANMVDRCLRRKRINFKNSVLILSRAEGEKR